MKGVFEYFDGPLRQTHFSSVKMILFGSIPQRVSQDSRKSWQYNQNSLHLLLEMSKYFFLNIFLMPLKGIFKKRILFEHPVYYEKLLKDNPTKNLQVGN